MRLEVLGRCPALHVHGDMNGSLMGRGVRQHLVGQVIHEGLQLSRAVGLDTVGGHLDFEVGTDGVILGVEGLN